MKIYISGKISGIEDKAHSLFQTAEIELQYKYTKKYEPNAFVVVQDFTIINPLKLPHLHDKTWKAYMIEDLKALLECDTIYMLKNWNESKGATIERQLALQLGLNVIYQDC